MDVRTNEEFNQGFIENSINRDFYKSLDFMNFLESSFNCGKGQVNINALNYLRFDQKSTNIKKFHDTDKRSVLRSIDSNSFKESIFFFSFPIKIFFS